MKLLHLELDIDIKVLHFDKKLFHLVYIKRFDGQCELDMVCNFQVPTVRIDDPNKHLKRPIQLSFEIPYFTVSGFQVRFMKIVDKSGYEAVPWVRYFTRNGEYSIRII